MQSPDKILEVYVVDDDGEANRANALFAAARVAAADIANSGRPVPCQHYFRSYSDFVVRRIAAEEFLRLASGSAIEGSVFYSGREIRLDRRLQSSKRPSPR